MAPRPYSRRKLLRASLALAVPAFGGQSFEWAKAADAIVLRLSIITPPGSTYDLHAREFADTVGKRSNGRLKIEVYPSGQLAKEYESINGLTTGTVDFSLHDATFLSSVFPPAQVFLLPFMFKDVATLYKVVDGPIGTGLFNQLSQKGIMGLSWGAGGFRSTETTTKAIVKVEDMKGLRFRIHGGADAAMMQALGAIPVTIDYSEVFTALSQHTIDGLEIGIEGITSAKLQTLIKHIAYTNHVVSLAPLIASKAKIESLPPDLQAVVKDSALSVRPSWRALYVQRANEAADTLKASGCAFTNIDWPSFRKLMTPIYASYESKIGADVLQQVSRAASAG